MPGRRALYMQTRHWTQLWQNSPPTLAMFEQGQELLVRDTRPMATAAEHRLAGRAREILLEARTPMRYPEGDAIVGDLLARRLLLKNGERYLSLPTLGEPRPYPEAWEHPAGSLHRPEHIGRYHPPAVAQTSRAC